MADGANATDAGGDAWHLCETAAFAEFFKTTKFGDMKACILHMARIIEVDGDLSMAFDPGDWIYGNRSRHGVPHFAIRLLAKLS